MLALIVWKLSTFWGEKSSINTMNFCAKIDIHDFFKYLNFRAKNGELCYWMNIFGFSAFDAFRIRKLGFFFSGIKSFTGTDWKDFCLRFVVLSSSKRLSNPDMQIVQFHLKIQDVPTCFGYETLSNEYYSVGWLLPRFT